MSLSDVFSEYDVVGKKGFHSFSIIGALSAIEEKEKYEPKFSYEIMAFSLLPGHDNHWKTYYGPQSYNDSNGNLIETPALKDITKGAVKHWEQRYKATKNPLLTMRYAGLVWDFKPLILEQKRDSELYRMYVDSMLKVCNEDYARHPVITTGILERVFTITKNNQQDLSLVKAAYINFENRHVNDNSARVYSSRFSLMIENKDYFSEEEITDLVNKHEQRLSRMCNPVDEKVNPWNIEKQATLLAEYYKSIKRQEDVKRVLNCIENAFFQVANSITSIQLLGNLEQLYTKYKHYGLEDDAKHLAVEIQKSGTKVREELKPHQLKITISKEIFDCIELHYGDNVESDEKRWNHFITDFLAPRQALQQGINHLKEKHTLSFLIPRKILDYKGRPMSVIGPYKDDLEGHLIQQMSNILHLSDPFLNLAIETMKKVGALSTDKIITKRIEKCPVFEEDRIEIIREALDLYFEKKYILSCHLLVPQIECAIRNLAELCRVPIIQPQKNNQGFQLRALDALLREKAVEDVFSKDIVFYLRAVLTDQRSLNIRNNLCHGFLPPKSFGQYTVNRLLHVLFIISSVKDQE